MKISICPICVTVSSLWLGMSIGVALGYLSASVFLVPIALLMGGTVVGIAYLGKKKKSLVVLLGMPIAYMLVLNLSMVMVGVEFVILLIIAHFFFIKRSLGVTGGSERISEIEEKIEQCC